MDFGRHVKAVQVRGTPNPSDASLRLSQRETQRGQLSLMLCLGYCKAWILMREVLQRNDEEKSDDGWRVCEIDTKAESHVFLWVIARESLPRSQD